jgi:hypothetical protein
VTADAAKREGSVPTATIVPASDVVCLCPLTLICSAVDSESECASIVAAIKLVQKPTLPRDPMSATGNPGRCLGCDANPWGSLSSIQPSRKSGPWFRSETQPRPLLVPNQDQGLPENAERVKMVAKAAAQRHTAPGLVVGVVACSCSCATISIVSR